MQYHCRTSIRLGLRHTGLGTPGKVGLTICCKPIRMVTCECNRHMDSIFRTISWSSELLSSIHGSCDIGVALLENTSAASAS